MISTQKLHSSLLAIAALGVLATLIRIVLSPPAQTATLAAYTFPETIDLPNWSLQKSKSLKDPTGHEYFYTQENQQLEIEARYINQPHPNEKIFRQFDMKPNRNGESQRIGYMKNIGHYSLSVENNRAFLRTCINPRGESTITYNQFIENRYTSDLQVNRIIPWLMGTTPLRDHRCLWSYLSVPVTEKSIEKSYSILESTLVIWNSWWKDRFPD